VATPRSDPGRCLGSHCVRYLPEVTYFLGGIAIGLVLLVVLVTVGVKGMRGRD
jgi:hypothetical protein